MTVSSSPVQPETGVFLKNNVCVLSLSDVRSLAHFCWRFRQFTLHGKLDEAVILNPHSHIHTPTNAHIRSHAFRLYVTSMICKSHMESRVDKLVSMQQRDNNTGADTLYPSSTVDSINPPSSVTSVSSSFYCLCVFTALRCRHVLPLSTAHHASIVPQPPACSPHSQPPSLSPSLSALSHAPASTFLHSLPPSSFSSSSSSSCAFDSLSFPLAHTLRQHPPLSTSTFTLTSLRSSHLPSLRHLLTQIIRLLSPSPSTLSSISSILPSFSHAQPCKLTYTHTHADWQPRTEHHLSRANNQEICLCDQASWHWAQLRKRTRKRPWSTATSSLLFPRMRAPGTWGSIPQRLHRDALLDHCLLSTTVSCSVSAFLVSNVWL